MTTWLEGDRSFFLGAQAFLMENDREMAGTWASEYVHPNPAYKYILGRFVEADRANNNRQLFSLAGLQIARPTITYAPMNMNHQSRRIVGAFVATDLIYPTQAATAGMETCSDCGEIYDFAMSENCPKCGDAAKAASDSQLELNPYIDALGVFWRHYFPQEYAVVEQAHSEGRLYYSMECIPRQIQCAGDGGCGDTFEYAGRMSPTYCDHLNKTTSDKYLIDPHFTAGAVLIPPVQPGWSHAQVHSLVAKHSALADRVYEGVASDLAHLGPSDWEAVMHELLVLAKQ